MADEKYDLYGGTPPFSDEDTSLAAALAVKKNAARKRAKVRAHIEAQGEKGATDDEIEVALGFPHQSASARRRELVLLGLVKDSGVRRKTRNGRWAKVWVTGIGAELPLVREGKLVGGMPSAAELRRALVAARALYAKAGKTGVIPYKWEFVRACQWLKALAGTVE